MSLTRLRLRFARWIAPVPVIEDPFPGETCQYLVMAEGDTRVSWRLTRLRLRSTSSMAGTRMKVVGVYERLPIFPRGFWERGVTGGSPGVKTWTYKLEDFEPR